MKIFFRPPQYLVIFSFLFLNLKCNSIFYQPDKELWFPPERSGLAYSEIWFPSKDGTRLHAWFFRSNTTPKGTILQYHGNAQNLTSHYTSLVWLTKHGYNLFIFDYRGYGKSENYPNREEINSDARSAYDYIKIIPKNIKGDKLILYGQSLGGIILSGMLTHTKEELTSDAVILEGTFDSYQAIARKKLSGIFITWPFQWLAYILVTDSYAPQNLYHNIKTEKILIIHGLKDQVIPHEFADRIHKQSAGKSELWLFSDVEHINTWFAQNGKYKPKLLEFLSALP